MRLHPREELVRRAEREVDEAVMGALAKHRLTDAEQLRVVLGVLSRQADLIVRFAIRAERHPDDPDKPGGLA